MEKTIDAIKTLRETLKIRNNTIEMQLDQLEKVYRLYHEESDPAQDIIHQMTKLEKELRLNRKLFKELSVCEYCKLADHNLCDICG